MTLATETVDGTINTFIFRDADSGFVIAEFQPSDNGSPFKIKGHIAGARGGIPYVLKGTREIDAYGSIFVVKDYAQEMPKTSQGIAEYLKTLAGCGPITSRKLVDAYGEATLDVILNAPEDVAALDGIGKARAKTIQAALKERQERMDVDVGLRSMLQGVATHIVEKAITKWGLKAAEKIKEDPYILTKLGGVGFETADTVALKLGFALDDPRRIRSGNRYYAEQCRKNGHTVFEVNSFTSNAGNLLKVFPGLSLDSMRSNDEDWQVWEGSNSCQLQKDWHRETAIALWIKERMTFWGGESSLPAAEDGVANNNNLLADDDLRSLSPPFHLEEDQQRALELALKALEADGLFILTGPPGTGKTYLVNVLLNLWEKQKKDMVLAAPTGKAAQRLREMTGREATTVHRLLKAKPSPGGGFHFECDELNQLSADLVVIDEVSMVDLGLFYSLTKAIGGGTALLLVGDHNQLPSVGPGCVLRDLLRAKVPHAELTTIKRQNPGGIVQTCHLMVAREAPQPHLFNILSPDGNEIRQVAKAPDLWLMPCRATDRIPDLLFEFAFDRLERYALDILGIDLFNVKKSIQVLTPRRAKHALGSDNLNECFREKLVEKGLVTVDQNHRFSPGDRVIQTKNDYKLEIFNGDTGTVLGIDHGCYRVLLDTEEEKAISVKSNNLEFAYALTIHKSQGSEWPIVVLPVHSTLSYNFDRPLLYTALSRAEKMCVVVGHFRDFVNIACTPGSIRRQTGLADRIRHYFQQT